MQAFYSFEGRCRKDDMSALQMLFHMPLVPAQQCVLPDLESDSYLLTKKRQFVQGSDPMG